MPRPPIDLRREQQRRLEASLEFASRVVSAAYRATLASSPDTRPEVMEEHLQEIRQLTTRPAIESFAGSLGGRENPISEEFLANLNVDPIVNVLGNFLHRAVNLKRHPAARIWAREEVLAVQEGYQRELRQLRALSLAPISEVDPETPRGASALFAHDLIERQRQQFIDINFNDPRCVSRISLPPHRHQDMGEANFARAVGNLSYLYEYGRLVLGPGRGMSAAALFVQEAWQMKAPFSRKVLAAVRKRWNRYDAAHPHAAVDERSAP